MTNFIFQFLWNQRERYSGIVEYFTLIEEVCTEIEDIELLGIYEPLSESWQWSYLVYTDKLEKWEEVYEEIGRRYFKQRRNITQDITRIYVERFLNTKPIEVNKMKYLEIELNRWEGISLQVEDFYEAIVQAFEGLTDSIYMGQYDPVSEPYTWAHLYWYESAPRIKELDYHIYSKIGRPHNLQDLVERFYKTLNTNLKTH